MVNIFFFLQNPSAFDCAFHLCLSIVISKYEFVIFILVVDHVPLLINVWYLPRTSVTNEIIIHIFEYSNNKKKSGESTAIEIFFSQLFILIYRKYIHTYIEDLLISYTSFLTEVQMI